MMNANGGFASTVGVPVQQILFCTEPQVSVGVIVDDAGVTTTDGVKIVKAGTPLYGSLIDRDTAFTVTGSTGATPAGVLLHDVDVTDGDNNGTLLIFGFVNLAKLDTATQTKIKAADLKGIFVCK